jgi:hypothetical protein
MAIGYDAIREGSCFYTFFNPRFTSNTLPQGLLTSDIRGFNTIGSFLNKPATATSAEEASLFAKVCKGATLTEKAFRLVASPKSGTPQSPFLGPF